MRTLLLAAALKSLALTHVTVIDGTGAAPQPDMTVVIAGDRITSLGKSGMADVPKGARVFDASGKFLIPGLWDMHGHLTDATAKALPLLVENGVGHLPGDYPEAILRAAATAASKH